MSNSANITSNIVDSNVQYAIGNDGKLYKYNNNAGEFYLYFTPPSSFPTSPDTDIIVYSNRILINSTTMTSVQLYAYLVESSGGLTQVLNFTNNDYFVEPEVDASPQLTKVFVVGNGNGTNGS